MNEYALGQTVYYFKYVNGLPILEEFQVAAIMETEDGYTYSQFDSTAYPFMPEDQLFKTIELAVQNGVDALEAWLP